MPYLVLCSNYFQSSAYIAEKNWPWAQTDQKMSKRKCQFQTVERKIFFRSLLFEIWSIFWFNYLLCCTVLLIRCEITSIRGAAVSKYETKTDFSDSNNLLKGPIELCVPPSLYLNLPPFFQRLLSRPSFLGMNCESVFRVLIFETWFRVWYLIQ